MCFSICYVNISLYNENLELFVSVALLLAGTDIYIITRVRASEQGSVYSCHQKKIVIERTRDLIYLKFVATDFILKIISPVLVKTPVT